jgi:transcriptional regulator with XRE-family HTH domain
MIEIGKKIKELRLSKHLTQEQLAERLSITKATISAYELGYRSPSYDVLIQVAYIFNTTTDYLLGRERKNMVDLGDLKDEDIEVIKKLITRLSK